MNHSHRFSFCLVLCGMLGIALLGIAGLGRAEDAAAGQAPQAGKVLRHVVLFSFKEGTTKEEIAEVETAFRELPKKIDTVADFEWGTDVSVENLADGFTHCFFLSFRDAEARAKYLPHPEHKKFVDLVKPRLAKVVVVDYWAQK